MWLQAAILDQLMLGCGGNLSALSLEYFLKIVIFPDLIKEAVAINENHL